MAKVDDSAIWFLAFGPLVGAIAVAAVGTTNGWLGFLIYFAVNTAFYRWDRNNLNRVGIEAPNGFLTILVPIYIWQRQHKLGKPYHVFVISLIALLLLMGTS